MKIKRKGFTYIELMIAMTIVTMLSLAIFSYIMVVAKGEREIKGRIDSFNIAQSILTELKAWDYKGVGNKNLIYLKDYLENNDNEYAKYMKEKMNSEIYEIYEISVTGGEAYIMNFEAGKVRAKVDIQFMEEDINDIDGDGITSELVQSNSDNNIVRINVRVAEYREGTEDNKLSWATATGYKGVETKLPSLDLVIEDVSDNDIDLSASGATILGINYKKNADIVRGLNNLDNFSIYDKDGIDNDNDGIIDYDGNSETSTQGDILEADSDLIDNDNDGIIDEAFEQDDNETQYSIQVYSREPFAINPDTDLNINSGDVGVWIKGPNDTSYQEITSNFSDIKDVSSAVYNQLGYDDVSGIAENTIYVYNSNDYVIDESSTEGNYFIKAIGRTRPDSKSGFYMKKEYSFLVDVTSPEISELSPAPGTFVPSDKVTIAVTAKDNIALDRIYVMEKRMLGTETNGQENYTWDLVKHKPVDLESADEFTSMNVGIILEDVTEGEHYYRVILKDRAGNVHYKETSVYVTHEPDVIPPVVKPLTPNEGTNSDGSVSNPYLTQEDLVDVTARISDSKIIGGVETQSGVFIGNEWPKVIYKIYEADGEIPPALSDVSISYSNPEADGFSIATSRVSFIKHNVNNVTMALDISEGLSDGDKVLVVVYAKDKAGNEMDTPKKWYIEKSSSSANKGPEIKELSVIQLANHPNYEPPYIYTPNWKNPEDYDYYDDQDAKTFHIGWTGADQDGIKKWELHFTNVYPEGTDPSSIYESTGSPITKTFDNALINDGESFGTKLSSLDLSEPGTFYFYIKVVEYDSTNTSDYTGEASYYYLKDTNSDDKGDMPANLESAPGTTGATIRDYWIPVKVENLRTLVFNLDSTENSDISEQYYTEYAGPFYWRYNDLEGIEDCIIENVSTSVTKDYLVSQIDRDDNGVFDDFDLVLFFSGSDTPTAFSDEALKILHRYFSAPHDQFRTMDSSDFYPDEDGDGVGDKTPVYYDASNPARMIFVGKRIFRNFASGTDMQKAFIERWIGLDSDNLSSYNTIDDIPYVVSNLSNFWLDSPLDNVTDINCPLFYDLLGHVKEDSQGDLMDRNLINSYIKKLEISNDGNGLYDGFDNQKDPNPDLWGITGEQYDHNGSYLPSNPAIHIDGVYNGPNDKYVYSLKNSLSYGAGLDNINYTAGLWMYPGTLVDDDGTDKWDFKLDEYYDIEKDIKKLKLNRNENTKLYYLGFNLEAISTERDRYMTLKRIIKYLNYE
ncbi:MAG TPA: prepilin-type N-terminal cleavage/methylation domain-containing protein [Candidatus Mcinerneyibacterium sp.]|nr:prepilin-type N-terminal cleavage/methylation domain-containing protein [Candidatus Mcinerneyibacterium sp.]